MSPFTFHIMDFIIFMSQTNPSFKIGFVLIRKRGFVGEIRDGEGSGETTCDTLYIEIAWRGGEEREIRE